MLLNPFTKTNCMLIDLTKADTPLVQQWLQSAIAPRPIGLVSTIDKDEVPNLAPFSFFNLFSANPPIAIFSPARRVRDNSMKHSFLNLYEVPEVVINIVTYDILHRVNLASAEFPKNENEFIKSGLTMQPATVVRPFMVKESKIKFECRVTELKPLGENGGAGNLVFCELMRMHINDSIIGVDGQIDPFELDQVGRLGGNWYCKTGSANLFELAKPLSQPVGIDRLPAVLKNSPAFSAEKLAQLAGIAAIPEGTINIDPYIQRQAASSLDQGDIKKAWELLVSTKTVV